VLLVLCGDEYFFAVMGIKIRLDFDDIPESGRRRILHHDGDRKV